MVRTKLISLVDLFKTVSCVVSVIKSGSIDTQKNTFNAEIFGGCICQKGNQGANL